MSIPKPPEATPRLPTKGAGSVTPHTPVKPNHIPDIFGTRQSGHHPPHKPIAVSSDTIIIDRVVGFDRVVSYSVDGSNNNPAHPPWGAAGTDEARLAPANFAAGTADTPVSGPNPRVISNAILANDPNNVDPGGRSAYDYAFGQFVDHDIDLNNTQTPNGSNTLTITAPSNDPFLSPGATINITRGQIDPTNEAPINSVTSTLDLSQVYGSDATTAASLRNPDGTLTTSAGGNLPIVNGQFVGGDIRVAENPDLTSVDVLFVREHNYWVGQFKAENPSLTGDQLYTMARSITTAEYQNIVYSEFLPSILGGGAPGAYQGYNPSVSPTIYAEFSTAAYRFGHTIISPVETKIANDGTVLQAQDLITAVTETTDAFAANGGADALLRNLGQDFSQQEGVNINSDLLNLLNAGADSVDLGAIDIERERDLGIATLNQMRKALGMTPYTSFSQVTTDPTLAAKLQSVYGTVDKLDLFVGGLAETSIGSSMVGPTFQAIIAKQFEVLRDGDPLFFQNQNFSPALMQQINDTTLSDLIMRNTNTMIMQQNAFVATERHLSNFTSPDTSAPQLVIGIDGAGATIAGTVGVDNTIVAGLGVNQMLTGGGTRDIFMLLGAGHADTVTDFQPKVDILDFEDLTKTLSFRDVVFTQSSGATMVQVGGNTITLTGIAACRLTAANFQFNHDYPALLAVEQKGSLF